MNAEVDAAVETAYRAFALYDLGAGLEVCRCNVCVAPEPERLLTTVPLRQLSADLLGEYTNSAHGWTPRVADQLRYFLPRYFELIAHDDIPSRLGIETCLARLGSADWRADWPRAEAAAIDDYFGAMFRAILNAPNPEFAQYPGLPTYRPDPAEDWLCMAAHAGAGITRLLAVWDATTGGNADLRLANVVGNADWVKRRLRNECWHSGRHAQVEPAGREVMAWLGRPQVRNRLEAACLAARDADSAALLSLAEGIAAGLQA